MLDHLKRAAAGSVLETHPHYRTAIGVLGITLAPILILMSLLVGGGLQDSISAYYFTTLRDWFVGVLWVIGVFLFFYRFRPQRREKPPSRWDCVQSGDADSWLGKIAGSCAIVVALAPTTPANMALTTGGIIHGISAAMMFLCLALFPLLLFSQSRKRRPVYVFYGTTMLVLLALVIVCALADDLPSAIAAWRPVLVLETLLITIFGVSWFTKGWELAAARKRQLAEDAEVFGVSAS